MGIGWKMFIRASAILMYLTFFFGAYLSLHVFLGNTTTIQDKREYSASNRPDYFPILVTDQGTAEPVTLELRSLASAEYSKVPTARKTTWQLYQQVKGEKGEQHRFPQVKEITYQIAPLAEQHLQVTVAVAEANSQRISTYTYDIKDNKVYPRSYILTSSFGQNFSPLPFLVMITGILIYLSEKFFVKRLLRRSER